MTNRPAPATGLIVLALALVSAVAGCGARSVPSTVPSAVAVPSPSTSSAAVAFDPETYPPPKIAPAVLLRRFAYDATAPLDVTVVGTRQQSGATIQTITYRVRGRLVNAEIVAPRVHHGRLPGVVLAHGGAIDPDAFLADALTLAKHGAVSILPDIPMTIVGNPDTDLGYVTDAVTAERRALDILVARPDVDAHRLGFVGHSWGADLAAIMAGVEPRLSAVAIVCGWSRMSTDMFAMGSPATTPAYMAAVTVLDGFRYVAMAGKRQILIQYGRQDPNIPDEQRTQLTTDAVGHTTRKDYDAGHDLINDARAAADRIAFLVSVLG